MAELLYRGFHAFRADRANPAFNVSVYKDGHHSLLRVKTTKWPNVQWMAKKDGTDFVITHALTRTCLCCHISSLRQYRAAVALKVIVGEIPVVRPVAKSFWSPLLERYWPEAEHLSNGPGPTV